MENSYSFRRKRFQSIQGGSNVDRVCVSCNNEVWIFWTVILEVHLIFSIFKSALKASIREKPAMPILINGFVSEPKYIISIICLFCDIFPHLYFNKPSTQFCPKRYYFNPLQILQRYEKNRFILDPLFIFLLCRKFHCLYFKLIS